MTEALGLSSREIYASYYEKIHIISKEENEMIDEERKRVFAIGIVCLLVGWCFGFVLGFERGGDIATYKLIDRVSEHIRVVDENDNTIGIDHDELMQEIENLLKEM